MPAVNVNIQPEIISWALSQTQEEKLGDKLMNNITHWLKGTKTPTFNQIEDFSKKANIPLGYFFLQTPPVEQIKLLEYRTVDSIQLANPSRNLIDTIHEMESVQDWMKEYRQELGYDVMPLVGSMRGIRDAATIVDKIRKDLELEDTWYEKCKDSREAFNHIRRQLEECGVIVMVNGIVGSNTHRPLDVNEFRAFAMVDEWAPLIFINTADSHGAKLFSLLHEVAHIWLGEDDLFNDRRNRVDGVSSIEVMCNAVAGELIVPKSMFLDKWDASYIDMDVYATITELSKYFRCGEIVIARKAMDCKKIKQDVYNQVVQNAIDNYNQAKESKKNPGGDYYNTMGSRLDGSLIRALCESINMGRTSYTEAYRLTNTSRKTFSDVAQRLGGVEW